MKVIFHITLPTGEDSVEIQEIAGMEFGHPRIYFIKKYPETADSNDYKGYIVEGRVGCQTLHYDHHLFSERSNPQLVGNLKRYVVLHDDPKTRSSITDRIDELEKGMLIKTKQIAILEARVGELRGPPRFIRYVCHGCEVECHASAYEDVEIKTKCPYAIWEEVQE